MCHVNTMKAYFSRPEANDPVPVGMIGMPLDGAEQGVEGVAEEESPLTLSTIRTWQSKPSYTPLSVHDIEVGSARPIKSVPYRVYPSQLEEMKKDLATMQAMGIIEPARSEWCSPVSLVSKKDGSLQLCVDFGKINAVTRKDVFPLPRVDGCSEATGDAKFLIKVDCLRGFWQVPLTPRDIS